MSAVHTIPALFGSPLWSFDWSLHSDPVFPALYSVCPHWCHCWRLSSEWTETWRSRSAPGLLPPPQTYRHTDIQCKNNQISRIREITPLDLQMFLKDINISLYSIVAEYTCTTINDNVIDCGKYMYGYRDWQECT